MFRCQYVFTFFFIYQSIAAANIKYVLFNVRKTMHLNKKIKKKLLFFPCYANIHISGVWLSLVERYVRDVEVAGSNPVTPTIYILKYSFTESICSILFSGCCLLLKIIFYFLKAAVIRLP